MKTAIIIGASGLTGQSLLNQLLKDEQFDRKYYENFLTEIEERKQESQEEMIR